jgi:hypothetical protein
MRSRSFVLTLALVGGCSAAPPSGEATGAIVSPVHPYVEADVAGTLGAVGNGTAYAAPVNDTTAAAVHEGSFTDGSNLANPNNPASVVDPGMRGSWISSVTSAAHTVSPNFATVLGQALDDGFNRELPKLDTGILGTVFSLFSDLGAQVDTFTFQHFFGYQPEYARWLGAFFQRRGVTTTSFTYSAPSLMASQRQRAARTYCAARQAQVAQSQAANGRSLGRQVGFTLNLFGSPIDFMVIEPTAVIDGPLPYVGDKARCPVDTAQGCTGNPNDGAQAFMIPFLFGTRVTPISLLPSLPEVRYPVVMVTGDSEVQTTARTSSLLVSSAKTYSTVTHADAFMSKDGGGIATVTTPLFFIGPVEVDLKLGTVMTVGQLYSAETSACGDKPITLPANVDSLLMNPPWATITRNGDHGPVRGFIDGPWSLSAYSANTTAMIGFDAYGNGQPWRHGGLSPSDPMLLRALEDDDRHVRNSTALQLCGGLTAHLPDLHLTGVDFSLSASGWVNGTVSMRHDLRDAVYAVDQDKAIPLAGVTITPSTAAKADVQLEVDLRLAFDLPWPIGTITIFDGALLRTPDITLASYESGPWAESSRLRIGTASSSSATGDPMMNPDAQSHVPNNGNFPALGQTVDQCLASPAPNPPTPPACGSQPPAPTAKPPRVAVCMYRGGIATTLGSQPILPANVCANPAGYVQSLNLNDAAQAQCMSDLYTFLCQPTSQQQFYIGQSVLARIFDPTNQAEADALKARLQECVNAYVPANTPNYQAAAQSFAQSLLTWSMCDANATLMNSRTAVTAQGDPSTAPAPTASSCQ